MNLKMLENTEFNYTPKEKFKIQALRVMVEGCSDLLVGTEDVLLSKFLHYTSWDVPKALDAMRRYYTFKLDNPDWTANHTVEHFREHFLGLKIKFVLPQPDREGRAIIIFKTVDAFDKYENYFYDVVEMDDLIFESLFLLPQVQKYGLTMIYDLSGTTKNFFRMLQPKISRIINAKNEVLPITNRMVHIIQKGFFMSITSSLVMPFMSKEIKERIFTHDGKDFDKLRNMIGAENLPTEYGGPPGIECDPNIIYDHLLRHADYLHKIQSYRKCTESEKISTRDTI